MSSDKRQKILSMLNEANLQTNEVMRLILGVAKHGHFDSSDQIQDFFTRMGKVQSCIVHLTAYHNQNTDDTAPTVDPETLSAEELDQLKTDAKLKAMEDMQKSLELYFKRAPSVDQLSAAIREQKKTIFDLFDKEIYCFGQGMILPGFSELPLSEGNPLDDDVLIESDPESGFYGIRDPQTQELKPHCLLLKSQFGWFVVVFANVENENDIYGEGRFYHIYKNTNDLDETGRKFVVADFTRSTQSVISMLLGKTASVLEAIISKSLSPLSAR